MDYHSVSDFFQTKLLPGPHPSSKSPVPADLESTFPQGEGFATLNDNLLRLPFFRFCGMLRKIKKKERKQLLPREREANYGPQRKMAKVF